MNKLLKTALTLVATGGFAISGVTLQYWQKANKFTSTTRLLPPQRNCHSAKQYGMETFCICQGQSAFCRAKWSWLRVG